MAEFGDSIMEGAIEPSVKEQAPVVDESPLYLAKGVAGVLEDVGTAFGGYMKDKAASATAGVLDNYREEAMMIADAMEQGLSKDTGRTRLRTLYRETMANNPGIGKELDGVNSSILSETGMGNVIIRGDEQAQREEKLLNEVYGAGWGGDVSGYVVHKRTLEALQARQVELSTRAAERGELSALEKEETKKLIQNAAATGIPWVQHQINTSLDLIAKGGDAGEVLTALKADVSNELSQWQGASKGEDMSYVITAVERLMTTAEDMVTGGTDTAVTKAKIDAMKTAVQDALFQDPEVAAGILTSDIFGPNANPTLMANASTKSYELISGLLKGYDPESDTNLKPSDIVGSDVDTSTAITAAQNGLQDALDAPTPEKTEEASTLVTNIFRSIGLNRGESARDYKAAIDFFASPTMEKWTEAGNLSIPAGVSDKAIQAVKENYDSVLVPLVEDEWINASNKLLQSMAVNNMGPPGMPIGDGMADGVNSESIIDQFIQPIWNGSSLTFEAMPAYQDDVTVRATVDGLNNGVNAIAPALNTLIRAAAHMSGNTDYNAQWEQYGARLFDMVDDAGDDELAGGAKLDQLNMVLPKETSSRQGSFFEQPGELLDVSDVAENGVDAAAFKGSVKWDTYLPSIRAAESGGNDSAKNPSSSATGRYQFIKGTWNGLVNRYPDAGLTKNGRLDPDQQEIAIRLFTQENAQVLTAKGIPTTNGNLYAAHFLGAVDAVKVLSGNPNDPLDEYISASTERANPFLNGWTVAKFKQWVDRKGGVSGSSGSNQISGGSGMDTIDDPQVEDLVETYQTGKYTSKQLREELEKIGWSFDGRKKSLTSPDGAVLYPFTIGN